MKKSKVYILKLLKLYEYINTLEEDKKLSEKEKKTIRSNLLGVGY